jgi:uncharacterized protein YcnI
VIFLVAASAAAHVVVVPPQSSPDASQVYTVRVHNEEKVATTSVEIDIPDGVMVTSVAALASGTSSTAKAGDRIIKVTWDADIPAGKYVELAFTARNPPAATQLQWNVRQHLADGTMVDWSDKPGAHGKPSLTRLVAPAPAKPAAP